ncbi:hypothetical protein HZA97_08455 [Candidatus Woesearchaeota archaeon]|nr:hypothetical protein [Candidatus Woesearchaeota archaeon]
MNKDTVKIQGLSGLVNEQAELAKLPEVVVPEIHERIPKSYEEMGEVIYLDLEKTVLYVTQPYANRFKLDAIIKGITLGDDFPPIFVSENPDGSYNLECIEDPLDENNYAGHHRAVAHLEAKKLLKCVKVKKPGEKRSRFPLKDVPVCGDDLAFNEYLATKEFDPRYR